MSKARAPTDENIKKQVLKEYRSGVGPKALSEKSGISINTIKSWIRRDKEKSKELVQGEPEKKKDAPLKRKKGAPVGNKNAEGAGAPKGSQNALKHGGYSSIYWDVLTDEEKAMIEETPTDEEVLLIEQIQLFAVRERRIMIAINKYRQNEESTKGNLTLTGLTTFEDKKKFRSKEDKDKYEKLRTEKIEDDKISYLYEKYNVTTNTEATINIIQRLERELSGIQNKKTKAIDSLIRLRLEKKKIDDAGKGNELVDDWITNIIGEVDFE